MNDDESLENARRMGRDAETKLGIPPGTSMFNWPRKPLAKSKGSGKPGGKVAKASKASGIKSGGRVGPKSRTLTDW